MSWLWWAPLGAAALHIGEEFVYPGGFAAWDRRYRPSIESSITSGLHIVVNALLLFACAMIGVSAMPGATISVGGLRFRSAIPSWLSGPAWLLLTALLFSNAVFHLVGSYRTKQYSPGMVTGTLLYVPIALYGYWHFINTGEVSLLAAAIAACLGGSYHLWASVGHRWRSRGRAPSVGSG